MNLTKGKISKLYSKKKQSLKRNKNKRGHSGKSKTFRKNRKVNLARKSLKRLHFKANKGGGLNDGVGTVNKVELPKETSDNKPVDENIENSTSKAEPSPFKFPPESSPVGDQTPPVVNETLAPVNETPAPSVNEFSPPVNETPSVNEFSPVVNETPSPSVDPSIDVTPSSPTVDESANNDDPELASAINNVVSLITEKVTKQVNANSSDAAQNGFKEIDDTARIMGSNGGGKKSKSKPKKSRKNKTRRKNKNRRIA